MIRSFLKGERRGQNGIRINTGSITGVSRDGRVIVGQGAGPINFQGYVIILPEQN